MTKRQRSQVVELLRCAADELICGRFADAGFALHDFTGGRWRAQSRSAGDVVELANLIADRDTLRAALAEALDGWGRWASEEHQSTPQEDRKRIAELRKLVKP